MTTVQLKTIGEMVAADYRTAQVFKNHNIDFCCKGNRSIQEASESQNVDPAVVIREIEALQELGKEENENYKSWPLDLLADYIEKKHHSYVSTQIPILNQYLEKLCQVHGKVHPELFEIAEEFKHSGGELTAHMKKEEFILFPFVRKMMQAKQSSSKLEKPHFGKIDNPVQMMMHEHEVEGDRFRKIAALSNDFTPPKDGCGTYQVTYALLREFEEDLHLHIHLENNILFPKSIAMEKELNG
ncbi:MULTISPECIES: iron-sulfur cluster repair di-iron protein [Rhodonellum]|nr:MULTISPECIES: iron-sulfur cluster repair di-iron protein [Rhodonellum]SDY83668.1 regulator of cell morphogenesis and NO signaling [Rhodonellum ikkaensis]